MYLSNRHLHPLNIPRFAYRRTRNWRNIHFRIHAYSISIPGFLQRLTPRGAWSLGPLLNDEWNNLDRKWGRNKLFMSFEIKSVPTNFQKLETFILQISYCYLSWRTTPNVSENSLCLAYAKKSVIRTDLRLLRVASLYHKTTYREKRDDTDPRKCINRVVLSVLSSTKLQSNLWWSGPPEMYD